MNIIGRSLIPVILLVAIFGIFNLLAKEVIFYSVPEETANAQLQEVLQWQIPYRKYIPFNGVWRLKHSKSGETLGKVRLPGTFQNVEKLTFEKKFDLVRNAGSSYILHLGPVSGNVEIRFNDSLLYRDTRNYYPLALPLPYDILHGGENTLEMTIKRENIRFGDTPAFLPINLPRIDTGVLSTLYLEIRPPFHITAIELAPQISDSLFELQGTISFNRSIPPEAKYQVQVVYSSAEKIILEQVFPITSQSIQVLPLPRWPAEETRLWSPDEPVPHWIEVTLDSAGLVLDQVRRRLAIRSVRAEKGKYFINSQRFYVNGINYVYQNTEGSELFDPDLARRDLEDIKSRGFNAIRVILHPLPEQFYQICDEVGLLCFQDLPFVLFPPGEASNHRNIVQRWQEYFEYVTSLAERYNSIAGIGMAFYFDGQSPLHRQRLKTLINRFASSKIVPIYASTLVPSTENFGVVDFRIIDIVERSKIEVEFQRIYDAFEKQLFFPSAYSKALSYGIDSTTVTQDLRQIHDFYDELTRNKLPGEIEGHFILTYSDYYLQLPSIQNGTSGSFSSNRVGLVDIKRQPRDLSTTPQNEDLLSPPEIGMIYEGKAAHSYLYILVGFLNVVLFLISYKRYRVFRQNLSYSIRKPHGFFVNLQERISIPHKQSFFLLLVISVNGAIVYSSLAFFYRNNLIFDYLLSLFFYSPWLKTIISRTIWDQALFLIAGTVVIILLFYVLAFMIKFFSLFGGRVLLNQALAASIWSAAPFAILLPLGIFMYHILLTMKSYWILFGILLYFHVWGYFRWINGMRVLTDRLYFRVFILFTFLILTVVATIAYFYNKNYNVLEHLQFVYHLYNFTN